MIRSLVILCLQNDLMLHLLIWSCCCCRLWWNPLAYHLVVYGYAIQRYFRFASLLDMKNGKREGDVTKVARLDSNPRRRSSKRPCGWMRSERCFGTVGFPLTGLPASDTRHASSPEWSEWWSGRSCRRSQAPWRPSALRSQTPSAPRNTSAAPPRTPLSPSPARPPGSSGSAVQQTQYLTWERRKQEGNMLNRAGLPEPCSRSSTRFAISVECKIRYLSVDWGVLCLGWSEKQ